MHIAQSGDAPPDWSDLEYRSDYRIDGRLPYDVESNLVLLGAAWRVLDMFVDPTLCNLFGGIGCGPVLRRIGLVLRLGAYFDVRITDFSDVPSELASARGSTSA